jgi:WD40 repeat protein
MVVRNTQGWEAAVRILLAIIAVVVLTGAARAADLPDPRPMLRIEPGMHTGPIKRIGVDAACTLMVTGSDDKTARLWALPQGGHGSPDLLRTLRVPIGDGNEGKVFAVALSPDGKWAAAGGWSKNDDVYIFEAATGRIVTRLRRLGNVINHLAFSPGGSRLAATLGGEGMRLWETAGWRLLAEDKNYGGTDSYGAAFDSANRLFTVAYDGQIRRYSADGRLEAKASTQGAKKPYSIAVHPQRTKLAIGFDDSIAVEAYDARTLRRLYAADTGGISGGDFSKAGWSADGARLYAGGRGYKVQGKNPVVIWPNEGQGHRNEAPLSRTTIMHLLSCGDDIAAGAQDPAFGLIAADGAKRVWQEGVTADMRNKLSDALTLSADGERVRFGLGYGSERPVLFDLTAFQLVDAPDAAAGLAAAKTSGLAVSDWADKLTPKLNGKPIALEQDETSRSLAIAPDASRFVLGAEYRLRAYRANGGKIWEKETPGIAYGVNISRDGRLLVVAYYDGTIRWHRLSDGQELLALFVHAKDLRFVAWTPKGYYAASPGAEDLIGWHVNRDWDHAADFFPVSRFRDRFNRPDIVKRVLDDLDEDTAVAKASPLAGAKPAPEIANKLPPVIAILSPVEGSTFAGDSLTLSYSLRSPSGLAISEVNALVDGRPLFSLKSRIQVSASEDTASELTLTGLPQRDLTLSLVARAGDLESAQSSVRIKFQGAPKPSLPVASTPTVSLYALVVGVAKFKDPKINPLSWAAKDARDFAAALKQQSRLYRKVEVKLLTGEEADSGAILDGLAWLERQAAPGDTGVVFLAGHGVTDAGGDYYYVPYNAKLEEVAGVPLPTRGSSVPGSEIGRALKQLAGNALFFFDTSHSGQGTGTTFRGATDYNKLINEIAGSANAIVLASSAGAEVSQERDEWQQGAFTKALLEGLAGAAGIHPKDGIVTIDELNRYVKERVKELTGGLQHPVDLRPKQTQNIAFAMVP